MIPMTCTLSIILSHFLGYILISSLIAHLKICFYKEISTNDYIIMKLKHVLFILVPKDRSSNAGVQLS